MQFVSALAAPIKLKTASQFVPSSRAATATARQRQRDSPPLSPPSLLSPPSPSPSPSLLSLTCPAPPHARGETHRANAALATRRGRDVNNAARRSSACRSRSVLSKDRASSVRSCELLSRSLAPRSSTMVSSDTIIVLGFVAACVGGLGACAPPPPPLPLPPPPPPPPRHSFLPARASRCSPAVLYAILRRCAKRRKPRRRTARFPRATRAQPRQPAAQ